MIPVRYDPAAESELLSQIQYLESQREGLGRRFFSEVKESEALILDAQGATILAVAHHRRKPGYWMPRVPGEER